MYDLPINMMSFASFTLLAWPGFSPLGQQVIQDIGTQNPISNISHLVPDSQLTTISQVVTTKTSYDPPSYVTSKSNRAFRWELSYPSIDDFDLCSSRMVYGYTSKPSGNSLDIDSFDYINSTCSQGQ